MVLIQITGEITEEGELTIQLPKGLPPGKVQVTIEVEAESTWTDAEIAAMTKIEPKTGAEIVAAGHVGGWEHYGITDSAEWVEALRRKRREQRGW